MHRNENLAWSLRYWPTLEPKATLTGHAGAWYAARRAPRKSAKPIEQQASRRAFYVGRLYNGLAAWDACRAECFGHSNLSPRKFHDADGAAYFRAHENK